MKKSELKRIIREEYQTITGKPIFMLTEETIVSKVIALILKPKINKEVKKIKNTPEYIELERQTKLAVKELEQISNRLEREFESQEKIISGAKKLGWNLKSWSNTQELLDQIKNRPGRDELIKKFNIK